MEEKQDISAFVITYNEEECIADCLKSLDFCKEIIVIDSFSKDRTIEIAKNLATNVIQREWKGYRDQKAFGLSIVKNQWVLNIDADERIDNLLRKSILEEFAQIKIKGDDHPLSGYYANRVVFFLNRWWRKGGWYPEYRLRFFRKKDVTWGGIEPHEKPIVNGKTKLLAGEIQHFTYKNIEDQINRLNNFSSISAREDFKNNKKSGVLKLLINPILRFLKFYFFKKGILEGRAGFTVAIIEGYYTFIKYAKLWELQQTEEEKRNDNK